MPGAVLPPAPAGPGAPPPRRAPMLRLSSARASTPAGRAELGGRAPPKQGPIRSAAGISNASGSQGREGLEDGQRRQRARYKHSAPSAPAPHRRHSGPFRQRPSHSPPHPLSGRETRGTLAICRRPRPGALRLRRPPPPPMRALCPRGLRSQPAPPKWLVGFDRHSRLIRCEAQAVPPHDPSSASDNALDIAHRDRTPAARRRLATCCALPRPGACRRQRHRIHSRLLLCIRPDMTALLGRSGRAEEFDVSLPDSLTPRCSLYMGTGLYGT